MPHGGQRRSPEWRTLVRPASYMSYAACGQNAGREKLGQMCRRYLSAFEGRRLVGLGSLCENLDRIREGRSGTSLIPDLLHVEAL